MLAEQAQAFEQQVAEIGGVQRLQPLLVGGVELARRLPLAKASASPAGTLSGVRPRFFQPSMQAGELRARASASRRCPRPAMTCFIRRSWSSVSRMVKSDCSPTSSAWRRRILRADGVERAEPRHALGDGADERADALLHLARRLVGEGDGEDLRGAARGPWRSMWAMRVVSTRVLPVPAPASTSTGPSVVSTALALLGVEAVEIARRRRPRPRARAPQCRPAAARADGSGLARRNRRGWTRFS